MYERVFQVQWWLALSVECIVRARIASSFQVRSSLCVSRSVAGWRTAVQRCPPVCCLPELDYFRRVETSFVTQSRCFPGHFQQMVQQILGGSRSHEWLHRYQPGPEDHRGSAQHFHSLLAILRRLAFLRASQATFEGMGSNAIVPANRSNRR